MTDFPRNASALSGRTSHHTTWSTHAKNAHALGLAAHALYFPLACILDAVQLGVHQGSSRDNHSKGVLPPIQRVSAGAAATAAARAANNDGSSPSGASNTEAYSQASLLNHARSAHIKLQACTTIKLSPLTSMNDGNNGLGSDGDRPNGGGGGGSSDRSGGSANCGGGLLVASVSECDSSTFDDDFGERGGSAEEDSDTDDDKEAEDAFAQRKGSSYEDRFRQRSPASQQFMKLADTVASDVAKGGSPAQSHLIQRMTLVSCCPNFVCGGQVFPQRFQQANESPVVVNLQTMRTNGFVFTARVGLL